MAVPNGSCLGVLESYYTRGPSETARCLKSRVKGWGELFPALQPPGLPDPDRPRTPPETDEDTLMCDRPDATKEVREALGLVTMGYKKLVAKCIIHY